MHPKLQFVKPGVKYLQETIGKRLIATKFKMQVGKAKDCLLGSLSCCMPCATALPTKLLHSPLANCEAHRGKDNMK
jgi:hypothetical protein